MNTQKSVRAAVLAAAVTSGMAQAARGAVSGSWIGPTVGSWTVPDNWSAASYPTAGGTAMFQGYTARVIVDSGSISLAGITFESRGDYLVDRDTFGTAYNLNFAPPAPAGNASFTIDAISSKLNKPGAFLYAGHRMIAGVSNGGLTNSIRKTGPGAVTLAPNSQYDFYYSGGMTISDGTLGMSVYGGALGYGTTTLNGGALQVLPVGTSGSPYGLNNAFVIGPAGGTLDLQSPLQLWTGSFTGAGAFTRLGPASLEIQRSLDHTGPTSFLGGGTSTTMLRYQGAITGDAPITVSGVLSLDADPGANRLPSTAQLRLRGGTLSTNSIATPTYNETLGPLIVDGGNNVVALASNGSQSISMSTPDVGRNDRGTLVFRGYNLGNSSAQAPSVSTNFFIGVQGGPVGGSLPRIGGGGAAGSTNVSIIPFALADGASPGNGTASFVTYDAAVGVRPLNFPTEYASSFPGSGTSDWNVRANSSQQIVPGGVTINSLMLGFNSVAIGGGTINVTSGAVYGNGGTINAPLNFGAAEGVIGNATLTGAISGSNGVTLNGPVVLNGGGASYIGPTTINSGTVTFADPTALGAGTIVLTGRGTGATLASSISTVTLSRNLTIRSDDTLPNTLLPALRGGFTMAGGITLDGPLLVEGGVNIAGNITGAGRLVVQLFPGISGGPRPVVLSGSNSFTGGVDVSSGIVAVMNDTVLGTGTLYVGNGAGTFSPFAGNSMSTGTIMLAPLGSLSTSRTFSNPLLMCGNMVVAMGQPGGPPPLTLTLNGAVDLNGEERFIATSGIGSLILNGNVSGGALRTRGTVHLSGDNSQWYTNVESGRLRALSDHALGVAPQYTQLGASPGRPVAAATLELAGGVSVTAGTLRVAGQTGAQFLRNVAGDNTWHGNVVYNPGSTGSISLLATVDADTLAVDGTIGGAGGSLGLSKGGIGTLSARNVRNLASLTINDGTLILRASGGIDDAVSVVNSPVTFAGATDAWVGRLDVTDNTLIVNNQFGAQATARNQIKSGYAGGAWTGTGIVSSTAAVVHRSDIGDAMGSDLFATFPATFAGQPITGNSLIIRYTLQGDANLDRAVDLTDFTYLASNFNGTDQRWLTGDFNHDGTTDLTDFTMLAANFNMTLTGHSAFGATVPEPATATILPAALALLLPRRRRRRHISALV